MSYIGWVEGASTFSQATAMNPALKGDKTGVGDQENLRSLIDRRLIGGLFGRFEEKGVGPKHRISRNLPPCNRG